MIDRGGRSKFLRADLHVESTLRAKHRCCEPLVLMHPAVLSE
jgi:hypothetical protein